MSQATKVKKEDDYTHRRINSSSFEQLGLDSVNFESKNTDFNPMSGDRLTPPSAHLENIDSPMGKLVSLKKLKE